MEYGLSAKKSGRCGKVAICGGFIITIIEIVIITYTTNGYQPMADMATLPKAEL